MLLAHIFLPAILIVICKSQQIPPQFNQDEDPTDLLSSFGSSGTSAVPADQFPVDIDLLDRYRQLIVKSLLRLYDSCKMHEFLASVRQNFESEGPGK